MQGVAANLAARMEQRYERSRFAEARNAPRRRSPMRSGSGARGAHRPEAPAKARAVVNLWRPWIEGRARTVLDRMPEMLFDQEAFGRLTRDLLAALNLADQLDSARTMRSRRTRTRPTGRLGRRGGDAGRRGARRLGRRFARRAGCVERGALDDSDDGTTDRLDREADSAEMPRRAEPVAPQPLRAR